MATTKRIVRGIALTAMLVFFVSTIHAQPNSGTTYTGALEYSIPLLTAVPPLYVGQPSDVASAYLWADELMRTTQYYQINKWIGNLGDDDTLTFLAETLYSVSDDNPLSLYQWEVSGWPQWGHPDYSWHYKANPGSEVGVLANQIGSLMNDTGRTGIIRQRYYCRRECV